MIAFFMTKQYCVLVAFMLFGESEFVFFIFGTIERQFSNECYFFLRDQIAPLSTKLIYIQLWSIYTNLRIYLVFHKYVIQIRSIQKQITMYVYLKNPTQRNLTYFKPNLNFYSHNTRYNYFVYLYFCLLICTLEQFLRSHIFIETSVKQFPLICADRLKTQHYKEHYQVVYSAST